MAIIKIKKTKISCFCSSKNIHKNKIIYKSKPKNETDFKIKKKDYFRGYDKCIKCGHYFSNHKYDLEKIYNKNYSNLTYGTQNKIKKTFKKIIDLPINKSDNKNRVKRVLKIVDNSYNCLDVGSGLGVFPYELHKKNINITALEKDKNLRNHLKHLNLKIKDFNALTKDKRDFDFISFNKIIEHIQKPDIFVKKFLKFIKVNGLLYIEVPSTKALNDKLGVLREEFFIEHFHVFSKKSLANLIKNLKLKVIYIKNIVEKSNKYTLIALAKYEGNKKK